MKKKEVAEKKLRGVKKKKLKDPRKEVVSKTKNKCHHFF